MHARIANAVSNSTLHVERWKSGNAVERQVRRTRPKVIAGCQAQEWEPEAVGRGFLPREIIFSRDHLRPSAANFTRVCMTAFTLRSVYYFTRWEAWVTLIIAGMRVAGRTGQGVQVEESAGVRGGGGGRSPQLSRNELKLFHEQITNDN